jgi:N-acetylmuramoyl-L-alanine amidase
MQSNGGKISNIVLHCSDTTNGVAVPAAEIDKWHKARGFKRIGYHIVIQPSGLVENAGNSECRGLNQQGAHVSGGNKNSIGICLIGRTKFKANQFHALRYQIQGLQQLYNIPLWGIRCHYQYESAMKKGKTCPNMEINRILVWLSHGDVNALKPYLEKEIF